MDLYKFDPPADLTLGEITQLFREMLKDIPLEQRDILLQNNPAVGQYLVVQEE